MNIINKNDLTSFSLEVSNWPGDGTQTLKLKEWENGEGYDLTMGSTKIELSDQELLGIARAYLQTRILK